MPAQVPWSNRGTLGKLRPWALLGVGARCTGDVRAQASRWPVRDIELRGFWSSGREGLASQAPHPGPAWLAWPPGRTATNILETHCQTAYLRMYMPCYPAYPASLTVLGISACRVRPSPALMIGANLEQGLVPPHLILT